MLDVNEPYEFDWDFGNTVKNLIKHNIECRQAEEVFLDEKSLLREDSEHSTIEKRFQLIGKDHQGIVLYVVFTQRKRKIRVISVRIASQKERRFYEQNKKV